MIHGVYLKNRPKGKWHLVSISVSPEVANNDSATFLNAAILQGNDKAETGIQMFESAFWIPETLSEIKEQKLIYN